MTTFALLLAASLAAQNDTYTVECRFTNPAYAGECTATEVVARTERPHAACSRILSCLNDSRCTKTYCNATQVRGGWRLVEAKGAGEPGR